MITNLLFFHRTGYFISFLVIICGLGVYIFSFNLSNMLKIVFPSASSNQFYPQDVFQKLDEDSDGKLNFTEFSKFPKYFTISLKEVTTVSEEFEVCNFDASLIKSGYHPITIKSFFQPLNLKSMSKKIWNVHQADVGSLFGLIEWKVPYKDYHTFSSGDFSIFLPPETESLHPGLTWRIIDSKPNDYSSSIRHFPLQVESKIRPLFALLCMFHPNTFLWTRFGPQGAVAVLKAIKEDFLDIFVRVHAEFQLNTPPLHPFWFTPAQFQGRIIISRNGSVVPYFKFEVPTERKLNVDMEWLNGPTYEDMEVDIGYIPRMQLSSVDPVTLEVQNLSSIHGLFFDKHAEVGISSEEAQNVARKEFYQFQQVKYHNLTQAFCIAKSEFKLVHGIILWGALDDQSC